MKTGKRFFSIILLSSIFLTFTLAEASKIDTSNETTTIPDWFKNNAGWWVEDVIRDDEFISALQHLIDLKIITISHIDNPCETSNSNQEIPNWVKEITRLWSTNQVNDSDFIMILEWLIEHKIINIPEIEKSKYASNSSESRDVKTYFNCKLGIQIEYPQDWPYTENIPNGIMPNVAFDSPREGPEGFMENVLIYNQDFSSFKNFDLEEGTDFSMNGLKQMIPGFKIVEREQITIDGIPAIQIIASFSIQNYDTKQMYIMALHDETLYGMVFTSTEKEFTDHLDVFNKMIDSTRIIK